MTLSASGVTSVAHATRIHRPDDDMDGEDIGGDGILCQQSGYGEINICSSWSLQPKCICVFALRPHPQLSLPVKISSVDHAWQHLENQGIHLKYWSSVDFYQWASAWQTNYSFAFKSSAHTAEQYPSVASRVVNTHCSLSRATWQSKEVITLHNGVITLHTAKLSSEQGSWIGWAGC